jgi:hypothetical protein
MLPNRIGPPAVLGLELGGGLCVPLDSLLPLQVGPHGELQTTKLRE